MMSKLKKYKFSRLYSMSSGISSKPEQAGHGAPFASFSTIFNNYFLPDVLPNLMDTSEKEQETYSIKKGDIFLTRTSETIDELGMSCVAIKDYPTATYSGFVKRLRPLQDDITYAKYMGFYLRSKFFRRTMTNNAVLTLRASLNEEIFSYLDLILPDFKTQKASGDFLHLLNTKIQLNNQINTELEAMAKTLYDYWFVQFDFPDADGKPYKTSGGRMVWNEELKREIPEGWEMKLLAEITDISSDSLNPMYEPQKEYRYYSIPVFDETGSFSIEKGQEIKSNKFLVEENDIMVSKLNPWFSRVAYSLGKSDTICSTEFIVWRCPNVALKNYLYAIARSESFISYCTKSAIGTSNSHKRVNPSVMMRFQNAFNYNIAEKFGQKIESTIKLFFSNKEENLRLSAIRDWLLPMLMNGQVTVGSINQPEVKKPAAVQIETLFISDNKKAFAKQVLGGKIVSLFLNDPHFTNIKFQKIQYLAEHVAEVDLNWNYYYQAAGPYDNVYMHTISEKLKTSNWFAKEEHKFTPLEKQGQIDGYYQSFFQPVVNRLDNLFTLLADVTDIEAEIIATLYAVWNNRIILNQPVNEELLIEDFYNWSDRKLLYTPEQLQKGLQWLHTNNITPKGFGKEMKKAKGKK